MRKNHPRADDGIRHAAARLSHRHRNLGEEVQIQRARALHQQVEKDRDQRHDDHESVASTASPLTMLIGEPLLTC